jgi:hypothetical protein
MVKGLLADNNLRGQAAYLLAIIQTDPWVEFWRDLGLQLLQFEDVGLLPTASDKEVWSLCQAEEFVLLTDNRNLAGPESLEATIRRSGTPESLPVFTIADVNKVNTSRTYAEQVVVSLLDYLQRIDSLRGTGRLYLP